VPPEYTTQISVSVTYAKAGHDFDADSCTGLQAGQVMLYCFFIGGVGLSH
jgi:hypothetical protein